LAPSGAINWVVSLAGAAGFSVVPDGDGDPVQIAGVVPGEVAGGWFGLHELNSTADAASGTNAAAAATLRRAAGLTMGRAYPTGSGVRQHAAGQVFLSEGDGIIECMFEDVIARFDELFERRHPSTTAESTAMVDRICAATRVENRAAAAQLAAIGDLFGYRLSRCSDTEEWAVDTEEAVAAEVAAALRISQALAGSRLRLARAMRERLRMVGKVFAAGDIDFRMFATIVYRTDLITEPDVLATVDARLAIAVPRWPSMTRARLAGQIDKIVATADADAVRRRNVRLPQREVWFTDLDGGISQIEGSLLSPDAHGWTSG
jgi:hypothetical protein